MADNIITTNITAHADFTSLRAQLAAVTAQLVRLQETTAGTNAKLANQIAVMNKSFATTLTSTGQFSQHFVSLSSDVDKFGKNLDRGRLKLSDYYNAWNGHTKKTSTLIRDLAKQQVMLQQAIVQPVGKNAQGHMQYNVMVAKGLDEIKNKMAIARQEAAIMNKVMLDGSTGLINWGKNTQWAGRQLTVGLTVPLVMFGAAAQKAFREADAELVRLTKVYGGLAATSSADLAQVRKDVTATAREIASSYGVAYKETIALAADLAATGQQGNELIAATQQTTRLAVLGEVDRQDAMKATLAIQNAFKQSTDELAQSIDFLNAVENQTSTSLADLTEAIPKAGPVIKSLGGDVKDLALYLTAMKEGGVNASEGANAIKSAMASLINPTKVATEQFMGFGIDLKGIVNNNAGDLTATILELQGALDNLNPLDKSRAIEQLFGKFQFARMSALFENLGKSGSQTLQVMDLMKASVTDLAAISERELKMMTESASGQFKRAWAAVQADLASVGEQFLRISTKVLKVVDAIITFFKNLPGPVKTFLNAIGGLTAIAGPLIMMAGVMGNFIGYVVKGIFHLRQLAKGGQGFKLLTPEIIAADAAAKGLATSFYSDSEATIVLSNAVNTLAESFMNLEAKANAAKVSVQPAVSTVAGGVIMAGTAAGGRVVDKDNPLVGRPYSRDMSHLIPSGTSQMGTIFGTVPGAKPVNIRVGRNPQAYMDGDLPKIPGLTSIGGTSTGIVAAEAAKWHAMTAAIAMQSQEELAILKKEVMATGTVTSSLSDSYQALLPEFSEITQLAAQETAAIVQQVQQNKITVEAARAKIIALNQQVEAMLAETTRLTAAGMGRTANLTVVPLTTQPVVDPITGKSNMKEMFHKGSVKEMADRIARALGGVRTSGAGYNIETTKPRFARGGYVPGTGNSDTYHTTAEPGSFVINKKSTQENKPFIDRLLGGTSYYANRGGQTPVVLTPGEAVIPADIAQNDMPLMYALNGGPGNTSGMGRNGGGATAAERAQAERNVRGASTWAARMEVSENWLEEKQVRHVINDAAVLNELGMSEVESIKTAKRHYDEARRYAYDPKTDKIDDARWAEIRERQAKELDKRLGGRLLRPMPVQVVTSRGVTSGRTVIPAVLPSPSLLDTIGKMGFSSPTELVRIRKELFGQSVWDPASRKWIPATHSYASEHDIRIGQYGYRAAGNYGQAIAGNKEINQWTATFSKLTGSHKTPFVDRIPGTLTEKQIALDTVGNVLGVGKGPGVAQRIMAAPERLKYNFGITKAFMSFLMSKRPVKMSMSKQKLNSGGTVAQRLFPGGTVFLGMPKTIKQVEAQRAARDAMVRADKAVADSRFSRNPVTVYDEKLKGDDKGHSFPVGGIGGVYTRNGEKFFVKPVVDEKRALGESRGNEITRGIGLGAPEQRVVVIKDPTDPLGRRKVLALESKYDPRFADMPEEFDENQYFKQLAASALRGDKDLARGNLGADRVADGGASGVFDTASGVRDYSRSMNSFKHQAMMNLLGIKGSGAKRFFAEATVGIPKGMTADQYHQRMLDEIEDMLPRLKQTISRFDLNSEEKNIYNEMIKRMEDARRENYRDLHGIHSSLQIAPEKTMTPAALAKMAAADELKRRQRGHAASLSDNDFKTPENGFILGGLIGAITKGKALHRIGAGFGKDSTGGWGVTSLEIGMAEKLFASTGLTKRTQRILYDKLAGELAKEMPYGYTKNAQGHLIKALEPDIMDTVIRSAASSTLSDPLGRKVLSQIDREILRKKFANWESKKDTSITDALKQLIFKLEGREKGGPVNAGQPYIVGEKGPELFVPRNAGGIVPNGYGIGGQIAMGTGAMAAANFLASKVANETVAMIIQQLGFMLPMMLSPMLGGGSGKGMIGRGLTKVGLGSMTTPLALSNKNPGEITKFGNVLVKAESSGTKFGKMIGKIGFGLTRFNIGAAAVVGTLMFLKNRWDANTESMRLNALGYGMTEEAAKKAGLKFRDFNKSLKESVETAKATREQNQLLYQSMTGSGTPLNITIAEFKKLKKTVKDQFADQIKLIDKTSADDQLGLAERLKTQFIGMGMTSEEATKKIYAMYTLSKNFSSDASLYTVSADGFNEIKTAVEAAAAAIKIYNQAVHEGRDGTEQADALTTANAALLNAIEKDQEVALKKAQGDKKAPKFISTADKKDLMLKTELATLEQISKEQIYQKTISQATLDELEKTNPTLFEIATLHDTNISLLQKQRLIARGFNLDMRELSATQVDQVYKFNMGVTQAIENVGRATFLKANYEKIDRLRIQQDKYTKAMKGQSAAQQISDRDKLSALQKQIDANNKLADARIKALDAAKKEGDIAREIAKAQARYEAALATGNTADAQQASLDMQGLQSDLQYEAQVKAIENATTLKNAPLLKQIELIQKKQQDVADAAALAAEKFGDLTEQIDKEESAVNTLIRAMANYRTAIDLHKDDLAKWKTTDEAKGMIAAITTAAQSAMVNLKTYPVDPQTGKPGTAAAEGLMAALETSLIKNGIVVNGDIILNGKSLGVGLTAPGATADLSKVAGKTTGNGVTEPFKYFNEAGTQVTASEFRSMPYGTPGIEYVIPLSALQATAYASARAAQRAFYEAAGNKGTYTADGLVYSMNGTVTKDKKIVGRWFQYLPDGQGKVKSYEIGGKVTGPGTGTSDDIPAYLSNGEYVIKEKSVRKYGVETFDALNAGKFADGGRVGLDDMIPQFAGGGQMLKGMFKGIVNFFSGLFKSKPAIKVPPVAPNISVPSVVPPVTSPAKTTSPLDKMMSDFYLKSMHYGIEAYNIPSGKSGSLGANSSISNRGSDAEGNFVQIPEIYTLFADPINPPTATFKTIMALIAAGRGKYNFTGGTLPLTNSVDLSTQSLSIVEKFLGRHPSFMQGRPVSESTNNLSDVGTSFWHMKSKSDGLKAEIEARRLGLVDRFVKKEPISDEEKMNILNKAYALAPNYWDNIDAPPPPEPNWTSHQGDRKQLENLFFMLMSEYKNSSIVQLTRGHESMLDKMLRETVGKGQLSTETFSNLLSGFPRLANGGLIQKFDKGGQPDPTKVWKNLDKKALMKMGGKAGAVWGAMEELEKYLSLKHGANQNSSGFSKWSRAIGRVAFNTAQGTVTGLVGGKNPVSLFGGMAAGLVEGLAGIIKDGSEYGVKGGSYADPKGAKKRTFYPKQHLDAMGPSSVLQNIALNAGAGAGLALPFGYLTAKFGPKIKEFANPMIAQIKDKLTNRANAGILNKTDNEFKKIVDSIYKEEEIFDVGTATQAKTFEIGGSGEKFAFQGFGEDLSGIAQSGATVVSTDPISILQTALRLNPKNKNIKSLLDNFLKHKETGVGIGSPEIEFLDQLKASVSINSKGENAALIQTEGFAMMLASLAGNKNAQSIVNAKTKIYKDIITPKVPTPSYVSPEEAVDASQIPVIHSTSRRDVVRQPDGSIHFYPRGNYHIGDPSMAYPRSSLHTTLGATVESHAAGKWGPDNIRVFSPLDQVLNANNNPYTFNPTDTWFQPAPGKPFIMPSGSIVRPFSIKSDYIDELVKRGLFSGKGEPPLIVSDNKSKEILQLFKEVYTDADREFIASRIPEGIRRESLGVTETVGKFWHKNSTPEDIVGLETQILVEIADDLAKKQININTPPSQISGWDLSDSDMTQAIQKLADQRGVPYGLNHQSSNPGFMEGQLRPESGLTSPSTWLGGDQFQSHRYQTLHGLFRTQMKKLESWEIDKDGFPRDFSDMVTGATGGYVRGGKIKIPGYAAGGYINPSYSPNMSIPKFETGINNVPADMLAMLHKNEAVVPANMNPFNPNANNATMGGGVYNITNNINGYDGNLEQLSSMVTQKTITAIKSLDSRTSKMAGPTMTVGIK
jgi:TP901 family phage tail tape measure protein